MDARIDNLTARVSHLERTNRVMKVVYALGIAVAFASSQLPNLSAAGGPRTVTAQKFNLVNAAGFTLATLGGDANGGNLTFYDSQGSKTVALGMGPTANHAGLTAFDGNLILPANDTARVRAEWGLSNAVGPAESFMDFNGVARAVLSPSGTDIGDALTFYDPNGKRVLEVGEHGDAPGFGLRVFDDNNMADGFGLVRAAWGIAGLGSEYEGIGSLVLNAQGRARVSWGSSLDGSNPGVRVYDADNRVRTGISVNDAVGGDVGDAGFFLRNVDGVLRVGIGGALDGSSAGIGITNGRIVITNSGVVVTVP